MIKNWCTYTYCIYVHIVPTQLRWTIMWYSRGSSVDTPAQRKLAFCKCFVPTNTPVTYVTAYSVHNSCAVSKWLTQQHLEEYTIEKRAEWLLTQCLKTGYLLGQLHLHLTMYTESTNCHLQRHLYILVQLHTSVIVIVELLVAAPRHCNHSRDYSIGAVE